MKAVFSDLDGTILDFLTYSYGEALEGINILKKKNVPLVLVSSKTLTEMMPLHRELKLKWPFIFENGGGLAYPMNRKGYKDFRLDIIGNTVDQLKEEIDFLKETIGIPIKMLFEMEPDEIIERTGLSEKSAGLVVKRITSVPFVPVDPSDVIKLDEVNSILSPRDILVTKGGRFYHFSSLKANKGYAVRVVIQYLMMDLNISKIISMGLGDSENDVPMLEVVDIPFLVRRHDGTIIETGNEMNITNGIGPAGFTEAIKSVFKS